MLPFVALLLFAILGIGAMNLDMGLAFAAKARLESAAETLALERFHLQAGGVVDPADQESELRDLLALLIPPSPRDTGPAIGATTQVSPTPVAGPVLGAGGDVELSQRVPLIFGMGAVPIRDDERLSLRQLREARESGAALLDGGGLRGRGLAPGGRALARAQLVLRVGYPQLAESGETLLTGLADVALDRTAIPSVDTAVRLHIAAAGRLELGEAGGRVVGRVIRHPRNGRCEYPDCSGWRVGDALPFTEDSPRVDGLAYVPIYEPGCDRVVGFVAATLQIEGADLLLTSLSADRVPENASAIPDPRALNGAGGSCAPSIAATRILADPPDSLPLLRTASLWRADLPAAGTP